MTATHWSKYADELRATACKIATPGKGILAADESTGTIGKRFEKIQVENTEANRTRYRELLFTSAGIEQYISGVITYEETLFARDSDGKLLIDHLREKGIVIGIKVDKGTADLPGTAAEPWTQGLDGLLGRCQKYYEAGARFAKWRSVIKIDAATGCPTDLAIRENAWNLARYGAICQQAGLVPIIEPEVLCDGAHSIQLCASVTERVLSEVYKAIHVNGLLLEGSLLKPNMVTPGMDAPKASPAEVAFYTVRTLSRTVPAAVPGVVFLSGGQSEEDASLNLNAINAIDLARPWRLTFSYGRALQASCLKAWQGDDAKFAAGQAALMDRAKANSEAQLGKYAGGAGGSNAAESLSVKNYVY